MTFSDWVKQTHESFTQEKAHVAAKKSAFNLYKGSLKRVSRLIMDAGTPIYQRDWDVLLVLDGCRYDLMAEFLSESEYDYEVAKEVSVGSNSAEWMENNFDTGQFTTEMSETAYVTGNLFSEKNADSSEFAYLDEVWRDQWDDDIGTIHPDDITDRAVWAARNIDHEYLVVHYMQPHIPFVRNPIGEGMKQLEETQFDAWDHLKNGNVSRETVWSGYKNNLEYAFESVRELISNVEGTVVITADHGNLLGEYGLYGHPGYTPVPPLRNVPWITTTGGEMYTLDGKSPPEKQVVNDINERLAALGYK